MYRLSAACLAGLALLPMACGTGAPKHDAQIASSRGFRLVLEMVCMPVVLDGQDFATAARARGMTPMAPASSPSGAAAQTYRLGFTGISATRSEDGSCMIGVQNGDGAQLQEVALASLAGQGLVMNPAISGRPAVNDGVASAYCSEGDRPLVLGIITPAIPSTPGHALITTLYRASDPSPEVCPRG